jgi:hypothetical protein
MHNSAILHNAALKVKRKSFWDFEAVLNQELCHMQGLDKDQPPCCLIGIINKPFLDRKRFIIHKLCETG